MKISVYVKKAMASAPMMKTIPSPTIVQTKIKFRLPKTNCQSPVIIAINPNRKTKPKTPAIIASWLESPLNLAPFAAAG